LAFGCRAEQVRRIDWIGTTALLTGLTAAFYLPKGIVGTEAEQWWHPQLFPSYGVGFVVCLIGRVIQKRRAPGHGALA